MKHITREVAHSVLLVLQPHEEAGHDALHVGVKRERAQLDALVQSLQSGDDHLCVCGQHDAI